jgi:S1-C subfamily serine protease
VPRALPIALAAVALVLALARPGLVEEDAARDLERARGIERRVEAVVARARPSVVTINVEETSDDGAPMRSGGSGVIIDPAGWVLTNDHVTCGLAEVSVGLTDGRSLTGKVTGRDPTGDLALIRVEAPGLVAAPLGDSEALRAGDLVLALGNPFGLAGDDHDPAVTLGVVSGTHRFQGGEKVYGDALQVDAAVNPGNSGGPLLDLDGRVLGLTGRISVRGGVRYNVGVGFAVPIHQVLAVLDALKAGKEVQHAYLGVRFLSTTDGAPGALVREVIPGSPAETAGLREGDRIIAVEGKPVDHPVRLQNYLSILPAGTAVVLRVRRAGVGVGGEVDVTVKLAPRPEGP